MALRLLSLCGIASLTIFLKLVPLCFQIHQYEERPPLRRCFPGHFQKIIVIF